MFAIRTTEVADVEAADTLLAAPIALIAVTFGLTGGVAAGLLATAVFAAAEAADTAALTSGEVLIRAAGFTSLGAFVGHVAAVIEQARGRFTAAFDNAPSGILLAGTTGRINMANLTAARMLGLEPSQLVGRTVAMLSDPLDLRDDVEWNALQAGELRRFAIERSLIGADGRRVSVLMAVSLMPSRSQDMAIVHLVDMTAQRRSEQQLAHLADHDPLTGLFNRRRFDEELDRHLLRVARHGAAGAVLLLDLDHFKYVNDTLGHRAGDVVLRAVAEALAARVRAEDVLARLGGDEFAILLPDAAGRHDVEVAAADILAVLGGLLVPMPADLPRTVEHVHVTASLGGVLIPAFATAERMITAADLAMYEAKEAGRGQARIHTADSPHAEQIRAGFTWGERIRRALDEDRFELWLQPIVSLDGARERQFEVLLRLRDAGRLWRPSEFLRHAERLGLMVEIDHYVVRRAVALLAQLPPQERPRLEVNLSAVSLGDEGLASWISEKLRQSGVAADRVILEITETVAIEDMPVAAATIDQLRRRGCGFALDDFGVGVSSFYYLRELPFDILKIDGAFVRDLDSNRDNQVIVRAMIDAAHGLGKTTVAEFVESPEVADILRRLQCDYAQGHLFGQAQPPAHFLWR